MRLLRHFPAAFVGLILLGAAAARAETPPDPLRLVPEQANLLIEVPQPRKLIETGLSLDIVQTLQALPPVKEAYDSTNARRFFQLLGYFEKELGARWPELLDRLASGGIVVASKTGGEEAPALFVIQGTDEALTRKFYAMAVKVLEQELARQESKDRPEQGAYRGVTTVHVGNDFHAAVAGSALLISNKDKALKAALDQHLDGGKKSLAGSAKVADARKRLPADALARLWLDLDPVKESQAAKEVLASPRNDPNLTVLFGGWLDVAARSPYLCAGLCRDKNGFLLTVRMPRGREGSGADFALHVPPLDGPGAPPLLAPKGVLFSMAFFLDFSKIWEDRTKLFNEKQAKAIEEADKNPGPAAIGLKPSQLLKQAGAWHRFVAVNQPKAGYGKQPRQQIPAFALVTEMRSPDAFSKSLNAALRAAALAAGGQYKLKLIEETHNGYEIVGWRFPEDGVVANDQDDIRFNFSPCFVRVGQQFAMCSTIELGRELTDLLAKEAKSGKERKEHSAVQAKVYGAGGAEALRLVQDTLVTQAVLDQATTPEEARKQVEPLIDAVRRLGVLNLDSIYEANQFRYDIRLTLGGAR